jgi:MFS family permease
MAIVGIAFGLGFIMGPAIGGFLGQFNLLDSYPSLASFGINPFSITAFFSLLLSLINLVWVYFKFEETLPSEARNKTQPEPFKLFSLFHHKNKQIKSLNLTYLIYMTAFSGMEFTLTFLAVDRFLFSTVQNGIMFVYIGLLLVITQGLLVRRFSPVLGEYKLSTFGLASGVVAFILLSQSTEIILFFIALAFMALSIGLTSPSMSALVSLSANEQEQGEILGLFRSAGSFARTIGPLIASSMYFLLGDRVAYLLGAFLVIIALFLFNYKVSLRTKNTGDANPA